MKTADAKRMLEAARAKAAEIGKPVSVAILDAAGAMVVFERINDSAPMTAIVAEGKAQASAISGRDSVQLAGLAQNIPALTTALTARFSGRFVPVQGAVTLRDGDGNIVGAIGVSGATAEEDETIAKAGAEKLNG